MSSSIPLVFTNPAHAGDSQLLSVTELLASSYIVLLPGYTMVLQLNIYIIELIISSFKFAPVMLFSSGDIKTLLFIYKNKKSK